MRTSCSTLTPVAKDFPPKKSGLSRLWATSDGRLWWVGRAWLSFFTARDGVELIWKRALLVVNPYKTKEVFHWIGDLNGDDSYNTKRINFSPTKCKIENNCFAIIIWNQRCRRCTVLCIRVESQFAEMSPWFMILEVQWHWYTLIVSAMLWNRNFHVQQCSMLIVYKMQNTDAHLAKASLCSGRIRECFWTKETHCELSSVGWEILRQKSSLGRWLPPTAPIGCVGLLQSRQSWVWNGLREGAASCQSAKVKRFSNINGRLKKRLHKIQQG